MSAQQDAAIQYAIDQALRALSEAQRTNQAGDQAILRRGRVSDSNGDVYAVEIVRADGTPAETLPGVRVWGGGSVALGGEVWLLWEGGRPIPWIVGGDGGSGGVGDFVFVGGLPFAS